MIKNFKLEIDTTNMDEFYIDMLEDEIQAVLASSFDIDDDDIYVKETRQF